MGSSGSYEDLFLANLGLVDRVARFVSQQHRLTAADAEEFASQARLKVIDDDYAVLREFKGQSTLKTYLVTVLTRTFLDDRTARWGRWRPSAAASRLGPTAQLMERLTVRDGLSEDAAIETARTNHQVPESAADLRALLTSLPTRTRRQAPSGDVPDDLPDPSPGAEEKVLASQRARAGERVHAALERAMAGLDARERLVLRMSFHDGLTGKQIAAAIGEEWPRVFRMIDKLVKRLRKSMEGEGIDKTEVNELLDHHEGLEQGGLAEFPRRASLGG